VQVDDIVAYLAKAQTLGGKKLAGPIEIPSGTFAWMSDPEGNLIGMFKPKA
jgi:predicted enzyme related to lactoylglutathione lyase